MLLGYKAKLWGDAVYNWGDSNFRLKLGKPVPCACKKDALNVHYINYQYRKLETLGIEVNHVEILDYFRLTVHLQPYAHMHFTKLD